MAKINHNNFLDTVNEVIGNAKKQQIVHLYAEDTKFKKGYLKINGKTLYHFGTTSYLALDQDPRLKDSAIKAIHNYGTQFPLSKTYISHPLYAELETLIEKMYGLPVIITKNSTLGHISVIPSAVDDKDGVILDHQVHWSVQNAAQMLKLRGIPVLMIRHNNLDMLETRIKELNDTCEKIWYMADGVYSMFGDYTPLEDLMYLTEKYSKLYLYFDDVHGMSWAGKHGSGYVMSVLKELPEKCLLFGTLSKSFGASGAVLVCKDEKLRTKIRNFGGPLTFSAQLEPASVAAAIASAKIHLSDEIYEIQKDLQIRISHFNSLLDKSALPIVDKNQSPVFYVGTGLPVTGYNFVKRLFKEGFFVNLGLFPAVPVIHTGVRITISRNNQLKDITALFDAMNYHYPLALQETDTTDNRVRRLFKLKDIDENLNALCKSELKIQYETSITRVDKEEWDTYMGNQSVFNWVGLIFLEKVFQSNPGRENNWDFHYIVIRDPSNTPVLMTFLTRALWKQDMLAPESVSNLIEEKRTKDKYYMSDFVLSLGSLISEGNHLFLDSEKSSAKDAMRLLLQKIHEIDNVNPSEMIVLRDFLKEDAALNNLLHEQGFIRIQMPESAYLKNIDWNTEEEYVARLSIRSRRHFKNDIKKYEDNFEVTWINSCDPELLAIIVLLYQNVKNNNLGLNTFSYPIELFNEINEDENWEFMILRLKTPEVESKSPVGMMCCYNNNNHTMVPVIVGMDYTYSRQYNTYRQLLYQTIKRAWERKFKEVDFGLTAAFEKRKLGATICTNHAYVQAKDNYFMEYMSTIQKK